MVQHAQLMVYTEVNPYGVALIVVASSCVALAYNVVHNLLLQRTSAVTVTVLGEVKIVGLLLLSALLLPGRSPIKIHSVPCSECNKVIAKCPALAECAV